MKWAVVAVVVVVVIVDEPPIGRRIFAGEGVNGVSRKHRQGWCKEKIAAL